MGHPGSCEGAREEKKALHTRVLSTHDRVGAARGSGMRFVCKTVESQLKLVRY